MRWRFKNEIGPETFPLCETRKTFDAQRKYVWTKMNAVPTPVQRPAISASIDGMMNYPASKLAANTFCLR
jgi:hypothetical protein